MLSSRSWWGFAALGVAAVFGVLLAAAGPAGAAFPGRNGLLAVVSRDNAIVMIQPGRYG